MDIEIGHAAITEAKKLASIYRQSLKVQLEELDIDCQAPNDKEALCILLDSIIADPEERSIFTARNAGVPVGFIVFGSRLENIGDSHITGEVFQLYVDPKYWHCQVGKKLIEVALADMVRCRHTDCLLWTIERDQGMKEFYKAAGWKETSLTRPDFGNLNLPRICFSKCLKDHPEYSPMRKTRRGYGRL